MILIVSRENEQNLSASVLNHTGLGHVPLDGLPEHIYAELILMGNFGPVTPEDVETRTARQIATDRPVYTQSDALEDLAKFLAPTVWRIYKRSITAVILIGLGKVTHSINR